MDSAESLRNPARWGHSVRRDAPELPLVSSDHRAIYISRQSGTSALEDDDFPYEALSEIAEIESWRKEINRPIYHIHKWWAQRLGSVFRAIVLAALAPKGSNLMDLYYRPVRVPNAVVFDPFMGSGTTLGEALKLGARVIGRDINPVAHFLVRNALSIHDRAAILQTYQEIQNDVAPELRKYYRTELSDGRLADVLYYFWVKTVDCPNCSASVDLFSSFVFARHAYPRRHPNAQAICPQCGVVNAVRYDSKSACCTGCRRTFDPQAGPVHGQRATCPTCQETFPIAKTVRTGEAPPNQRLYAKLVLLPDGQKKYLATNGQDRTLYAQADIDLEKRTNAYPVVAIEPGYNTNQALGYNYRYWHQMFNARQLLSLSILSARIKAIGDPILRDLFTCLFSGALEFNNMFTSYKGEGTGAVRHMFAHHILKPERVPLEANLWGTPKSSGSFSTMFEGRIRRALDYADDPFELRLVKHNGRKESKKVFGLSEAIGYELADRYEDFAAGKRVYLSCGDSGSTDLPDRSVDAVITDPPFFDNVHYSQLADFFHVWQRHILGSNGHRQIASTRSQAEVQNSEVDAFTARLEAVWREAHRVLKDEGIFAFTYHHSRSEGWSSILQAIVNAGFAITAVHPIKSEMSVAMPKHQAKEPIDLDIIIVCRKMSQLQTHELTEITWVEVTTAARKQIQRLRLSGRNLSRNDVRVIVMAQLLRQLSLCDVPEKALNLLNTNLLRTEEVIDLLNNGADVDGRVV